jgi:hypothetical protein
MIKMYNWQNGVLFSRTTKDEEWKLNTPAETIAFLKQCIREIALDFYENDKGECCSDIGSKGVLKMIGE